MKQLSRMTLSYLPMERKLFSIYCMMKILQSLKSLILSQIQQLVINFNHRLKTFWIVNINGEEPIAAQGVLDELNLHQTPQLNPRSRSVYAEGKLPKNRP